MSTLSSKKQPLTLYISLPNFDRFSIFFYLEKIWHKTIIIPLRLKVSLHYPVEYYFRKTAPNDAWQRVPYKTTIEILSDVNTIPANIL